MDASLGLTAPPVLPSGKLKAPFFAQQLRDPGDYIAATHTPEPYPLRGQSAVPPRVVGCGPSLWELLR